MSDVWFRGQSSTLAPAQPGGSLHDLGMGLYFTDTFDVARRYAEMRVKEGGGVPQIYFLNIEGAQIGNVLDLTKDARWLEMMRKPITPRGGPTPEQLIRLANENYSRFFESFVATNGIDLKTYNAVIGPEFVRGGRQICFLDQGGRPSAVSMQMRQLMRLMPKESQGLPLNIPTVMPPEMMMPKSRVRRMAEIRQRRQRWAWPSMRACSKLPRRDYARRCRLIWTAVWRPPLQPSWRAVKGCW